MPVGSTQTHKLLKNKNMKRDKKKCQSIHAKEKCGDRSFVSIKVIAHIKCF